MPSRPRCPNPECLKPFQTVTAVFVHLGRAKKCKAWDRKTNTQFDEDSSDWEGCFTDSSFDEETAILPWRKTKPLPKRAQRFDFEVPVEAAHNYPLPVVDAEAPNGSVQTVDQPAANGGVQPIADAPTANSIQPTASINKSPVIDKHPSAGESFGEGKTIIDEILSESLGTEREQNIFHPFRDSDDFEMGAWLIKSGISMAEIDKFLKLPWVSEIV